MLGADADEVLERLFDLGVGVAASLHAVDDVLGELGVLAVAVCVGVVFAVFGADLEPRVHAVREDVTDFLGRVGRRRIDWVRRLRGRSA